MSLALGTAQFGMPYGVTNKIKEPTLEELKAILELARNHGITLLDTAHSYGDAELKLGALDLSSFNIVSKLPAIPSEYENIYTNLLSYLELSLKRLGQNSLYGLLLHRPDQLCNPAGGEIYKTLQRFKAAGLIQHFGVSIYSPNELGPILDVCEPNIVQAPLNVFDQRLIESGWLDKLVSSNIEIHTRSTFLQGLLLLPRGYLPTNFKKWSAEFDRWHDCLKKYNISASQACLAYAQSFQKIEQVIVGVGSVAQLNEIVAASLTSLNSNDLEFFKNLSCGDEELINPSKWQ